MNISNFDLNLLRAFDVLMRERSVTRAAEELNLTQPAMSNVLRRLREFLDDPVLVRTGQGMQPTPKALSLITEVRAGLSLLTKGLSPAAEFLAAESVRTFHMAATDYVQLVLLPRLLKHFKAVAPGIKIEIHELGFDIPIRAFEIGKIDFAVGRFVKLPKSLQSQSWRSEELVCLVRENHPKFQEKFRKRTFLHAIRFGLTEASDREWLTPGWMKTIWSATLF